MPPSPLHDDRNAAGTPAVDALLATLGGLFTTADDATAQALLEEMQEADSRVTAVWRRARFRVVEPGA